eukprot:Nitzschia sp. Nitz4//scaffold11_size288233//227917//230241//NITZ4_000807-RA/size288233-processed-gene-0.251-mRNA-1//-1//CDS//3329534173//8363//frame0
MLAFATERVSTRSTDVLKNADSFSEKGEDGNESSVGDESSHKSFVVADDQSKKVYLIRTFMLVLLVSITSALSLVVFYVSRDSEQESFRFSFKVVASKVTDSFRETSQQRLLAIESFASQLTSYARASNSIWPNVAFPDFERRASAIADLSDALPLVLLPIVSNENRQSYEKFTVENQGWFLEGLDIQGIPEEEWDYDSIEIVEDIFGSLPNYSIQEHIVKLTDDAVVEHETGDGPFLPVGTSADPRTNRPMITFLTLVQFWQFSPVIPVPSLVNYNTLSHATRRLPVAAALDTGDKLVAEAWDFSEAGSEKAMGRRETLQLSIQHSGHNTSTYVKGPVSDIYIPVFNSFDQNASLVALLSAGIYWQKYFENTLVEDYAGVVVVLENSCKQTYSFQVRAGIVEYLGQGDLHQSVYDDMVVQTDYGGVIGYSGDILDVPDGHCLYRIRVYPTKGFEDHYVTSQPRRTALIMTSTFVLTCAIFLLYDKFVEARLKIAMESAIRTGTVVRSIFPEEVRKKIYESQEASLGGPRNPKEMFRIVPTTTRKHPELEDDCMAIADLYPDCTVCFLDIVGFPQWSSGREPWKVFKLLESLYKAYDKRARRLGVFKVETVGDSYVAVAGLPHAQKDHATLMARFASDCFLRFGQVTHQLVDQLGEDVLDLSIRGGLHSGPVTAGVLRGAKARFQLFGDTVNTASRMESTGTAKMVQLSNYTASLLSEAGFGDWTEPRDHEVEAKGKGHMQTHWLLMAKVEAAKETTTESSEKGKSAGSHSGGE